MLSLRDGVVKVLMSTYDFTIDDAEEMVAASVIEDAEIWHDEAIADNVAKYLATEKDQA